MTKKLVSWLLTLALLLGCAGLAAAEGVTGETEEVVIDGITYHKAADMTTEPIELTYFHFDQDETVKLLAERFMQIYPNIKVTVQYENVSTYDDTLLTLMGNSGGGIRPDVIMYSDCDFALSNMLLRDISAYWDSDPETQKIASTINSAGVGTFMTKARYAVPVKFFPTGMYIDRNVLEALNMDAPERDWTWEDMIELIKEATVPNSPDGIAYYGCGYYNRLDSYYGIAASQDIIGEFGFDGKDFDLSVWAVGEQEFSDLKLGGYIAPSTETQEMEDWLDDWEAGAALPAMWRCLPRRSGPTRAPGRRTPTSSTTWTSYHTSFPQSARRTPPRITIPSPRSTSAVSRRPASIRGRPMNC